MDIRDRFRDQVTYLGNDRAGAAQTLPARLAMASYEVLPIAAASISIFDTDGFRLPVAASCARAAYAERLQFTTGEGPALDVRPGVDNILADGAVVSRCWPRFHERLFLETPYRSVAAFPVRAGADVWATVDLYFTSADDLHRLPLSDAVAVVEVIGAQLAQAWDHREQWTDNPMSEARGVTAKAVTMLATALQFPPDEVLRRLQDRAATARLTVDALADAIVSGRTSAEDLGTSPARCGRTGVSS